MNAEHAVFLAVFALACGPGAGLDAGPPDAGAGDVAATDVSLNDSSAPMDASADDSNAPFDANADSTPTLCPELSAPEHGAVDGPDGSIDSVATYTCEAGFVLTGNEGRSFRRCDADGQWSGDAPTCALVETPCDPNPCANGGACLEGGACECAPGFLGDRCEGRGICPVSAPIDGSATPPEARFEDTVLFGCDEGFSRLGADTAVCLADGTLSEAPPTCCPDHDGDGVCDLDDVCGGFPDEADADGDGTPDGCDCDLESACAMDELCTESGAGVVCEPDRDGDGVPAPADCDDDDERVYPGADEVCDGVDNDCDPNTEEPAIVHDGLPVAYLHLAILAGGQIELCGPVTLRNPSLRYERDVTITGRSPDAAIEVALGRLDFDNANVTIEGLRIVPAAADIHGIRVGGGSITIRDSTLANFVGSVALNVSRAPIVMEDSEVINNNNTGCCVAGGVHFDRSTAIFTNVVFEGNTSNWYGYGGGAMFIGPSSNVTMTGCTIQRNHHTNSGIGGVLMGNASDTLTGGSTLRSIDCDWGLGPNDNDLYDLVVAYRVSGALRIDDVTNDIVCTASSNGNTCSPL